MRPAPGETISDPGRGTGGFLLAAHDRFVGCHPNMSRDRRRHLTYAVLAGTAVAGPDGTADAAMGGTPVERIAVRSRRAITLVAVDDISYVEAESRYARIHAAGRQHLARYSLAELERMLDGMRFVRVHRSAIVNLRRIRSMRTVDYR